MKGTGKGNLGKTSNNQKCHFCGAIGHFAKDCFKRKMAQNNSMDVSYVELALDDGTTVYAVWDDSTEDYWYFDEEADDD